MNGPTSDTNRQVDQPDTEVKFVHSEELRIVSDELFAAVQQRLAKHKQGPRGPRKSKPARLWDLVTELFKCAACSTPGQLVRFYHTGGRGHGMQCKHGPLCNHLTTVCRKKAVEAVCDKLGELIVADTEMAMEVICQVQVLDADGDQDHAARVTQCETQMKTLKQRVEDLFELAGCGSEQDRAETKAKIRTVQAERLAAEAELQRLRAAAANRKAFTRDEIRAELQQMGQLLKQAAAGELGEEAVYKALAVFESLVGGVIMVHVEQRPGRKETNVRGVFRFDVVGAISDRIGRADADRAGECREVEVWLREPPFIDKWARRAYELVDLEGLSYRDAAKVFQTEHKLNINSGKVWQLRHRYFEMLGQPTPSRPYNNGRPRKSA